MIFGPLLIILSYTYSYGSGIIDWLEIIWIHMNYCNNVFSNPLKKGYY